MSTTPCPSDDQLSALAAGTLAGAPLEAVERHVDGCPACRKLLAVVSNGSAPAVGGGFRVLRPGDRLGRYEIERLIGAGGMGVLYVAHDPQLNRRVALKLMRPAFAAEGGSERLRREAQAMATLAHPNVVNVFDIGETDGRVFMAMELADGGTLREWMKGRHSWRELLEMFCAAGEGLAAAHAAGVVHRDFKPENVLLGKDGRPRVGDFGLARPDLLSPEDLPRAFALQHSPMGITQTGTLLGTPAYMSPEQLRGKPADQRSDQYGFCVCLYEALAGHRPFPADTLEELRARIEGGMPAPPKDGLIPAHLWAAIARGLNPKPEARFPDMRALLDVLKFAPKAMVPTTPRSSAKRSWGLRVGLAMLSVALIGAGVFANSHRVEKRDVDPIGKSGAISLVVGARKEFNAPNLGSVSVDPQNIVRVEKAGPNDTVLILEGLEPGTATLGITNTSGSMYWHQVRVQWNDTELLPPTIPLMVGKQTLLTVPKLVRAAVGEPSIVDVKTIGDEQVLLVGSKAGKTTLRVWMKDGTLASSLVSVSADTLTDFVTVEHGQEAVEYIDGAESITLEDPSLAKASVVSVGKVQFEGLIPGTTPFTVTLDDGRVTRGELTVQEATPVSKHVGPRVTLTESVTLGLGQIRVFDGELERVAVADPEICDVKLVGHEQLMLLGTRLGATTLVTWLRDGKRISTNVQVVGRVPLPVSRRLDVLPALTGVEYGMQIVLDVPRFERIAIGDPAIADVKAIGDSQVLVIGSSIGRTTLVVWTQDGRRAMTEVLVAHPGDDDFPIAVNETIDLRMPYVERVTGLDPALLGMEQTATGISLTGKAAGVNELRVSVGFGEPHRIRVRVLALEPDSEREVFELSGKDPVVFNFHDLQRVSVDDPSIASAAITEDGRISLRGVRTGKTGFVAWRRDGSHRAWLLNVK
ncbi:MAG: pilus assembly protein N-terminal domain-containing protein [Archangium sp.]